MITPHEQAYIDFFSTLTPASLAQLDKLFSADAHFKDPFNDVHGLAAIRQVFEHMFATTQHSRFVVQQQASQDAVLFLQWDYHFETAKGKPWCITGTSLVRFDQQGLAVEHTDYWDPAEAIYSKIPVLKWLIAALNRRLSAA